MTQYRFQHTGLFRRLAIMLYDLFVVVALIFLGTNLVLVFAKQHIIAPHNHWFQAYLAFIIFAFYAWFWTHGGQTIGMVAWRTRVQTRDGNPLSWHHALKRFVFAIPSVGMGGIGLFWMLFDNDKLSLHDRLSGTELLTFGKER